MSKTYVKISDFKCPFGERDLSYGHNECYSGSGKNRCPYFVKYDWNTHQGCIECTHPTEKIPADRFVQGEFDFG